MVARGLTFTFIALLTADLGLTPFPWLPAEPVAIALGLVTLAWLVVTYHRASGLGLRFSHARVWQILLLPIVNLYLIHGLLQDVWRRVRGAGPNREITALCVLMAIATALDLGELLRWLPAFPVAAGVVNAIQDVLWLRLVLKLETGLSAG